MSYIKQKNYGISGELLTWLCDYLRLRSLRVMVNGQVSSPFKIAAGVPQCSILGPTLFLIDVNDAEDCLSPRARMSAYADDTTMYTLIHSTATIADSIEDMSASLDHLQRWGERWRVRFKPTKSQSSTSPTTGLPGLSLRYPLEGTPSPLPPRLSFLA